MLPPPPSLTRRCPLAAPYNVSGLPLIIDLGVAGRCLVLAASA